MRFGNKKVVRKLLIFKNRKEALFYVGRPGSCDRTAKEVSYKFYLPLPLFCRNPYDILYGKYIVFCFFDDIMSIVRGDVYEMA